MLSYDSHMGALACVYPHLDSQVRAHTHAQSKHYKMYLPLFYFINFSRLIQFFHLLKKKRMKSKRLKLQVLGWADQLIKILGTMPEDRYGNTHKEMNNY